MFGLFQKKTKEKEPEQSAQSEEFKEFAARFLPDELDILAVTGANGFGGARSGEKLWRAGIGLTAWMEEDSPEIHRGETELVTLADDQLLEYLRRRTPRDFIIKCRARLSEDGKSLLLLNIPEPGFDPDLKAILEEQKKPVSFWVEGLGTFTLNRQVNWFETEVDWLGAQAPLSFDRGEPEEMEKAQKAAKALLTAAEEWDRRIREYAAGELLSLANEWAEDAGDGEPELTREDFIGRMELDAIQIDGEDSFTFWFSGGEMFCGHSIRVSGTLSGGPDSADMEG